MRITIEPTTKRAMKGPHPDVKVTVEVPQDELTIWQMADLLRYALLAHGYGDSSIRSVLSTEQ